MCAYKIELLNQTLNGRIFRCSICNKIHIEYKNLNFNFSNEEYEYFKDYFFKLEPEKWEIKNRNTCFCRKVMVPIGHRNFNVMFHTSEIYELKNLLNYSKYGNETLRLIKLCNIELKLSLN